jgi:hypothetical protein
MSTISAGNLSRDVPSITRPGRAIAANHHHKAIVEGYSDYYRKGGLVDAKDREVLILATSVSVRPEPQGRM